MLITLAQAKAATADRRTPTLAEIYRGTNNPQTLREWLRHELLSAKDEKDGPFTNEQADAIIAYLESPQMQMPQRIREGFDRQAADVPYKTLCATIDWVVERLTAQNIKQAFKLAEQIGAEAAQRVVTLGGHPTTPEPDRA